MNDLINRHHYENSPDKPRCHFVQKEKKLHQLISNGDEGAFAQLFEQYKDRVYSMAFRLTKSNVTAEEIVQNVFLKIWLKRAGLNDIRNFSAYLFIVARNDVYKFLKQVSRRYKTSLALHNDQRIDGNDTADLLLDKEYNLLLQNAIQRLPNQQKQIYSLVKDRGFKRAEVAQQLHIQPETVKFHLAQAMKNIRAFCMPHLGIAFGFTMLFY